MKWLLFPLLILSLRATSQNNSDCATFKTGTFYSKNAGETYSIRRKGRNEIQTNLKTGDSTIWEISWQNDCTYILRYLRGNEHLKPKEEKFLTAHQVACRIETITPEYYIYSAHADEPSKKAYATDTIWTKPPGHAPAP